MVTGGNYDVIIIGSGIAGSALAFELEKNHANYLIFTEQKNPLSNTSSLSYGHCRIPGDLDEILKRSVVQLGEDEERMRFVYSRAGIVLDLFKELNIDFEYRSFGIIPSSKKRGGKIILKKLQQYISSFETGTELTDFIQTNEGFEVNLRKNNGITKVKSKYLVLATGGYGGTFTYTDSFRYKSYNVFDIVKKNGGKISNLDCIFVHPFGYANGKKILIGDETKRGEFIDSKGNYVFDKETRRLIKDDNYHEVFNQLLEQENACRNRGSKVYFADSNKKIEIVPTVHYTSGGIKTNYLGEVTGCKDLFAVGECSVNGSRNGGRFPGYPFTSAIVYGKVLGQILSSDKLKT